MRAGTLNASPQVALRTSLRDNTSDLHRGVERHPLLTPLVRPGLTFKAYAVALKAFHGFYAALEPWLLPALESGWPDSGDYRYRPRTALIAHDLRDLGCLPETNCDAGGESPVALESPESVMGVLYVLEGATQGGRVIEPRVIRELDLSPIFGARYFHLHAERRWDDLLALMASSALPPCSPRAEEGARQTFLTLQAHLDHWHQAVLRS